MADDFWEKNYGITPQPVSDTVVWRAGNQMIKRYGAKAAMEAAMRSNAALEIGDSFNYELWQRVCMAVQELERQNPGSGESLH
jgi:hypothetical protein